MDSLNRRRLKEKVVVVMGTTGTGKSRLSIDLAAQFPSEIINSDKMQVYKGLDIVTNKVTMEEQRLVPHHLLGVLNPDQEFTASHFRWEATMALKSILGRDKLPIIAGGSNSYIEALVDDKDLEFRSKYDCCFLWVDVAFPVLHEFVSDRVDQMVENGLVDEVKNIYDPQADYGRGIRRAIGVPELDRYIRGEGKVDEATRARLLEAAIDQIKANTCKLTCCQLQKIHRLRTLSGWNLHRLDATQVFQKRGKEADDEWEKTVAEPAIAIVRNFLRLRDGVVATHDVMSPAATFTAAAAATAYAGATR